MAFVITGGLGLIWVTLWLLFYQSPARHTALSKEEREYVAAGQERRLQADGARPSNCHSQPRIDNMLQVTKLYALLVAFGDEAEALRRFGAA